MLLLHRHSANQFAIQGLSQTYGRFRRVDARQQALTPASSVRGRPWTQE